MTPTKQQTCKEIAEEIVSKAADYADYAKPGCVVEIEYQIDYDCFTVNEVNMVLMIQASKEKKIRHLRSLESKHHFLVIT